MSVIAKIKCVVVVAVLFIGSAACEPVSGGEVSGSVAGLPGQEQPLPQPQPEPAPEPETPLMSRIRQACPSITTLICERTSETHPGVKLTESDFKCGVNPNHIFILEIEMSSTTTLRACTPDDMPVSGKRQDMIEQAKIVSAKGPEVYYGVNGDFFGNYKGDGNLIPMGVVYVDGKAYQSSHYGRSENVLYVRDDGSVEIGKYRTFNAELSKVKTAIGGYQTLVWDGVKASFQNDDLSTGLHPRTFVGVTKDRNKVYVFVVDGRQKRYSIGLNMSDMADICLGAGCDRAFNLDGGGSTTLVVQDGNGGFKLLNKPSDSGVPRAVVDGLLVVKK